MQIAEATGEVVLVPAVLGAEAFGVERPAFGKRRVVAERAELAKTRQGFGLLLNRELKMMSGDRLVIRGGFQSDSQPRDVGAEVGERNPVDAGLRTVRRGRRIVGRGALLGERGLALDGDRRRRAQVEGRFGAPFGVADEGRELREDGLARIGFSGRPQRFVKSRDAILNRAIGIAERFQDFVHLGFDARDFLQTDGVDLLGRQRRAGRGGELSRVERLTVRKTPRAGRFARIGHLPGQQVAHLRERRENAIANLVARCGNQFGGALRRDAG